MFERFDEPAQHVMRRAAGEAAALDQRSIGTEHLLLALLDEHSGLAADVLRAAGLEHGQVRSLVKRRAGQLFDDEDAAALRSIGVDLDAVIGRLTESFGTEAVRGRRRRGMSGRFDDAAKAALGRMVRSAVELHDKQIRPEHMLLGVLGAENTATAVLAEATVDRERLRADLLTALGKAA